MFSMVMVVHVVHGHGGSCVTWSWWFKLLFHMLVVSCSWWFMFSMVMVVHVFHGHGGSCFHGDGGSCFPWSWRFFFLRGHGGSCFPWSC